MKIRLAKSDDWTAIWPIVGAAFRAGDTYAYAPDTGEDEARRIWLEGPTATYVAVDENRILGTYYIKPNQPGCGDHVCNAGYIVDSSARGRGIGRAMCEHSLAEAARFGFRAMQYNLVVSTNVNAVSLWKEMGFHIVGTLERAFDHSQLGLVDAHVMYRMLQKDEREGGGQEQ